VIVTLNKGRDIYPMVQIKKYLSKYDYIGHFHDKNSPIKYYLLESWTKDIMYMMINCTNDIISNFIEYDELGIVIADVPSLFRYKRFIEKEYNEKLFVFIDKIWNNLKIEKKLKINENKTFVFSYGTYLWFKYDALKPFFNINENDIPNEPLGRLTNLHLIERIFIYIAWSQNYDFKISSNLIQIPAFLDL
jgi:rhamnosyltransferase